MRPIYKTIIIVLCSTLLLSFVLIAFQYNKISYLQEQLSFYEANAITCEITHYHYTDEYIDETVIWERGYEYGYSEAYNEVHSFYEDYIASDEFLNDYSLKRDY